MTLAPVRLLRLDRILAWVRVEDPDRARYCLVGLPDALTNGYVPEVMEAKGVFGVWCVNAVWRSPSEDSSDEAPDYSGWSAELSHELTTYPARSSAEHRVEYVLRYHGLLRAGAMITREGT